MLENATVTMSLKDYEELKSYKEKYFKLTSKDMGILIKSSFVDSQILKDELSNLVVKINNQLNDYNLNK